MHNKNQMVLFCLSLILFITLACGGTTTQQTTTTNQNLAALTPGDTTRSLTYGGEQRNYILHIPSGYDPSQSTPMVLVFHGFGLSAEEMIRITGFNTQADEAGFITVYPNGSGRKPAWNGGDCCGEAAAKNVDDVGFVNALIEDVSRIVNLDQKRIYATGFSNGAIMSYRLACELSDQIAAIGPVSATQALPTCSPERPVPVIHFHGTDDSLNPYEGGTSQSGIRFASVSETIEFWVEKNDCPVQGQVTETGSIIHEEYSPCAYNASVELYTIIGGEHAWPGGESVSPEIGEPTTEISATLLMWEFFAAHPMP